MTEDNVLDYLNDRNWMKLEKNPTHDVDLFFIYPTIVDESGNHDRTSEITDEVRRKATIAYENMGAAFEDYTNVYVPYYRQIPMDQVESDFPTHYGFLVALYYSDAKRDIFAALDYYFENYNNDRPFILAGHSQGSALTLIVLGEYMKEHPEYYRNMVAAYPLGFGFAQEWLDDNPHLKFATGETDTGVIIGFNVEGPGGKQKSMLLSNNSLNINPLNWKTDETYAPASLNKGTKYDDFGVCSDAQINKERGVVVSTNDKYFELHPDPVSISLFGTVALHGAEYVDFYNNLKENGHKRIQAFMAKKRTEKS